MNAPSLPTSKEIVDLLRERSRLHDEFRLNEQSGRVYADAFDQAHGAVLDWVSDHPDELLAMLQQPTPEPQSAASKEQIHRVCQWLCEQQTKVNVVLPACQGCNPEIDTPYGKATPACVLRAQELIELVQPSHEPATAPIAAIRVGEDSQELLNLYAPGLPPGDYDLYLQTDSMYFRELYAKEAHAKKVLMEHYSAQPPPAALAAAQLDVGADMAIAMSRYVHGHCKDVPHDIGLWLMELIGGVLFERAKIEDDLLLRAGRELREHIPGSRLVEEIELRLGRIGITKQPTATKGSDHD